MIYDLVYLAAHNFTSISEALCNIAAGALILVAMIRLSEPKVKP